MDWGGWGGRFEVWFLVRTEQPSPPGLQGAASPFCCGGPGTWEEILPSLVLPPAA